MSADSLTKESVPGENFVGFRLQDTVDFFNRWVCGPQPGPGLAILYWLVWLIYADCFLCLLYCIFKQACGQAPERSWRDRLREWCQDTASRCSHKISQVWDAPGMGRTFVFLICVL